MKNQKMKRAISLVSAATISLVADANADSNEPAGAPPMDFGWSINVENPVLGPLGSGLPQQTKITISATIAGTHFAFAAGEFDLIFSEGTHGVNWTGATLLAPLNFDPSPIGTPVAGRFNDIRPGQIHFPAGGINADSGNPIAAWEVTYTATDFSTDRTVDVRTETERFDAYLAAALATSETVTLGLEGMAAFQIVPEPGSVALGGVGALMLTAFVIFRRRAGR
jgi:hypothetical protein